LFRSILDIVKDQLVKEKKGISSVQTTESREPLEDKKEFYLNLQELVSESKKEKNNSSFLKAPVPKVFSMSIAEHVQRSAGIKSNPKTQLNKATVTPVKVFLIVSIISLILNGRLGEINQRKDQC